MGFPRRFLNEGEELVLDLRPHWLFLAPPVLVLILAIGIGAAVFALGPEGSLEPPAFIAAIVVIAAALVFLAVRYAVWTTTNFVLTSDRLIARRGVLAKAGTEIPLERINTVFFKQSIFERLVGAGDLVIESAGERGSESFTDIRKPAVVQREIYIQMEGNENRKFDRVRAPGTGGLSVAEQLEKLHGLVQQGVLTPAQFEAEKVRLLGP